jgi:hypothetical protein
MPVHACQFIQHGMPVHPACTQQQLQQQHACLPAHTCRSMQHAAASWSCCMSRMSHDLQWCHPNDLDGHTSCLLRLAYPYEAYSFRKIFRYLGRGRPHESKFTIWHPNAARDRILIRVELVVKISVGLSSQNSEWKFPQYFDCKSTRNFFLKFYRVIVSQNVHRENTVKILFYFSNTKMGQNTKYQKIVLRFRSLPSVRPQLINIKSAEQFDEPLLSFLKAFA